MMKGAPGPAIQAQAPEAWRREAPGRDCGLLAPKDAGDQLVRTA